MGTVFLTIFATGTGMAIIAGLGVAAPAVPPMTDASSRRMTKPATRAPMALAAARPIFQLRITLFSFLFRRLHGLSAMRRHGIAARTALPPLFDHRVEHRHEYECENGGRQHAAEHRGADGLAARGARASREHQ